MIRSEPCIRSEHCIRSERRAGAYYDSIVLMQLQSALKDLDGVEDAGAVMATEANLEILAGNDLLPEGTKPGPSDLLVVVRAAGAAAADTALGQVDTLLRRRSAAASGGSYRPRSLSAAVKVAPASRWVLVSVPGRYAADVAGAALDLDRHVFLYSDNVRLADEVELKRRAVEKGLLVMGPDCGTAIVGGVGFGFANRVRRGTIGLVAASGTGLQAVASGIHNRGAGVSHAIGTGGRDLNDEVGGKTALQALDLLARDPRTEVIAVISKPPAPRVARRLLEAARDTGKPVVVNFLGYPPPARRLGNLRFAVSLGETAQLAVELQGASEWEATPATGPVSADDRPHYLRGLFAGGTLAYEALQGLRLALLPLYSNLHMPGVTPLPDLGRSVGHTLLDMGEDDFTVGRLHPMMDQDLRLRRLRQEAADPEVAIILLDVVLGDGAHPDPASEIAAAVAELPESRPEIVAVVVGTDEDPQDLAGQIDKLKTAGIRVFSDLSRTVDHVDRRLGGVGASASDTPPRPRAVALADLETPEQVVNVGVSTFGDSLAAQDVGVVQVDWQPPAGGNEKLQAILKKMRT